MSTRARIGIQLPDDSILSVYHHFDGYPEGLGVKLVEHYNTYEKASELIDGGNMSNCYSDSKFNVETGEFTPIADPKPSYYGGDEEAPILSKNFDEFTRIDCWQEYSYVFVKDRWVGYSVRDVRHILEVLVVPLCNVFLLLKILLGLQFSFYRTRYGLLLIS